MKEFREQWEERRETRRPSQGDYRTQYEVDYGRIVHSSSFRRLQGKTQIHQVEGDIHRTRLTHSLEVAQIALGIAQRLRGDYADHDIVRELITDHSLIQVVGLVHDMGHPPGGHAGEEALNACIKSGFEGNGQTIRILTKLESFSERSGANLTRRTLLGALKYPKPYSRALGGKAPSPAPRRGPSGVAMIGEEHKPPKCYHDCDEAAVTWMLKPYGEQRTTIEDNMIKSFDCSLMDKADDTSYGVSDLDDAIAMKMLPREILEADIAPEVWSGAIAHQDFRAQETRGGPVLTHTDILDNLYAGGKRRKSQTGWIINYILSGMEVKEREGFTDPLYRYAVVIRPEQEALLSALQHCVYQRVIMSSAVQQDRMKLQRKIIEVYDAMAYQPQRYLPDEHYAAYERDPEPDRAIADYIAGMTDRFLGTLHARMFG